jgi:hypothetical protein
MVIVARAVVGLTATGSGSKLIGELCRPFLPSEVPLLGELYRECERLGLPGLGKHRLALASRQPRHCLEALGFRYTPVYN